MKNLKSYFIYFKLRIICELQYRSAALAGMTTQFFFGFVYIMVYVAFYNKTNSITIPEIPIISILAGPSTNVTLSQMTTYLWLHQVFYFTFLIRQRDNELLDMIKTGNITYELCKPLNLYSLWFIKIMSKKVIGTLLRFWPIPKILTLILMLISSVILFFCIYLIGASFCFITTEGIEVRNVLTEGGKEMAQYPINIYSKPFKLIFTFIIPFALVNYYPLLYILDIKTNLLYTLLPLLTILYIIPSNYIFKLGLRKYSSTGS